MKSRQHQNKTPAALPDLKDGASRGVKGELNCSQKESVVFAALF